MADADLTALLAEATRIADGLQFACRIPDKVPDSFACGGPAAEAYWSYFTPSRIVGLIAAVEAALKLAEDWQQEAERLQQVARRQARSGADADRRGTTGGLAVAHIDCANALREAIAREMTAKET